MSQNEKKTTESATIAPSAPTKPQAMTNGATIVVQSLINCGVDTIFAYPGGYSIPLHQAFSHFRDKIRVVLPRHEQAAGFAAQGYARATGKVGVCMTTSGPGATNIITAIADAKLDSVPIVVITGQVNRADVGSDSFQETPMTEVCRCITKHHYLVADVDDLARVVKEAIFVAKSGRPGPVLVDIPKNLQVDQTIPNYDEPPYLPGYPKSAPRVETESIREVVDLINKAKRPVIVAGGGVVLAEAYPTLLKISEKTGIPVATTMPGLAAFPRDHANSLGMAGMHGTFYANRAIRDADLVLAFGFRFSERVTGNAANFAKNATIVQFDVDPSEFNKVKKAKITVLGHLRDSLAALDVELARSFEPANDLTPWREQIAVWRNDHPVSYSFTDVEEKEDLPTAQFAISELSKATQDRDAIISVGVGQHQLWTTLFYRFNKPRTWLASCGFGTMGFGLPAAMGAKIARPEATCIAIEGDGSLQMNIQELATCVTENIPVKLMVIDNQFLGNVMQWEDVFFKKNRANTYLGRITDPENFGGGDGYHVRRYPDFCAIARGYEWEAVAVEKRSDFPDALRRMLESDRPFLLDLRVPYREHVLPMIPPGQTVDKTIFTQE